MVQFRVKALNQLQKPDDLDLLMKVTKRRGWVALGVLAAAIIGLITWSFAGSLPVEVAAEGILEAPNGVSRIDSSLAGQVVGFVVSEGDRVAEGDPVLEIIDQSGELHEVTALYPGAIVGVLVDGGNVVEVGTPLYLLERSDLDDRLVALLFPTSGKGQTVAPGMTVDLTVESAPSAAFGVLRGVVESVDPFPASQPELYALLGDAQLAAQFSEDGPPSIVTIELLANESTVSGLQWSTRSGPPFELTPGAAVRARILQGEQRPIDLVFGR